MNFQTINDKRELKEAKRRDRLKTKIYKHNLLDVYDSFAEDFIASLWRRGDFDAVNDYVVVAITELLRNSEVSSYANSIFITKMPSLLQLEFSGYVTKRDMVLIHGIHYMERLLHNVSKAINSGVYADDLNAPFIIPAVEEVVKKLKAIKRESERWNNQYEQLKRAGSELGGDSDEEIETMCSECSERINELRGSHNKPTPYNTGMYV